MAYDDDGIEIGPGQRVFGVSALALGVLGLRNMDFATLWQPVPETIPYHGPIAIAAALLFLLGGAGLQSRRTARMAAIVLAVLYGIFTALWARRILAFPQIFATWGGTAEQLALLAGSLGIIVRSSRIEEASKLLILRTLAALFGLCAVAFGFNHFFNMGITASMVPAWIPPGGWFWALATGLAHVAAGIAIMSGLGARLAARLLTLMFASFGILIWLPRMISAPSDPVTWTGNSVNLSLIGAAWIIAEIVAALPARAAFARASDPGRGGNPRTRNGAP